MSYLVKISMIKNRKAQMMLYTIILCTLLTLPIPPSIYAQEDSTQAIELELKKPLDGVISKAGASNWYKFNATADSSYVIEVFNQSLTMTAFFTLYSPDGGILGWSYSKMPYNFTESGTYLVEVEHSDSKYGVGTYSILLRPALPPSVAIHVYDLIDSQPIKNAVVRIYTPVSYTLIEENLTAADGDTTIQLSARGYYIVTVNADGYDDIFGVTSLLDEGPNTRWAALARTGYTGLVISSALVKNVVAPGESNIIEVSVYNLNTTYPITLTDITVILPWFGFYEGQIRGGLVVTDGMPITIPPNTIWTASIPFTAPSDVTAYVGVTSAVSYVDFNAQAPAWRITYDVVEGVGLQEIKTLTTADIIPELQESQGFRTPLVGISLVPITDPLAIKKLDEVSVGIQDISSNMEKVTLTLNEVTFRVGEVNAELAIVSSRLKSIISSLDDTNEKMDEVNSKLSSSDNKLASISSGLTTTNDKLNDVTIQLETVNREISSLSSHQQETNSKLDTIDKQLTTTRDYADNLLTELFGDLRTLLLALIGVTIIIAAVNTLYLAKNFGLMSK